MELPTNPFKRALKEGRLQIGLWSSLASHVSVELLAGSGFDSLPLDCRRPANEVPMVHTQRLACVGGPAHRIVRPPWNDMVMIKRLLDIGTQSFLIPYVQEEAGGRAAVEATGYPPYGMRGFASAARSSRFGRVKDYHTR